MNTTAGTLDRVHPSIGDGQKIIEMMHFALSESGPGQPIQVKLEEGANIFVRTYDPSTGRPSTAWTRQQAIPPAKPAISEADQLFALGRQVESSNAARAMDYYRMAANLGQTDASLRLGLLLISQSRPAEGLPLVQRASDAGIARADYVLGLALVNGEGITKDAVRGRRLLARARDHGFAAAAVSLATDTP